MTHLQVNVLGEFQVWKDDVPVSSFESDKVRALLAYLVVEAGRYHRRDSLVGLLWPDYPEGSARHNLSQALFNLRHVLGDHNSHPPYLLVTRDAIQINRESDYSLDLDQFNQYFGTWEKSQNGTHVDPAVLLPQLEAMAQLYRGEFLQQFFLGDSNEFEQWAMVQRELLHQREMNVLATQVCVYERQGDYASAHRYALRQLELDPWREEVHYQVMRLLALNGQRSAALAQYENCRKVLAEAFGVEPSPQTEELHGQIQSGSFKPKVETPTDSPVEPSNLVAPAELQVSRAPLIGRESELSALLQFLRDPSCRLLTLTGLGGIGKTRLAVEVAAQMEHEFRDGVYFVSLASVNSKKFLLTTISDALGFSFYGPTEPKDQLLSYLRHKSLLIVLDSFDFFVEIGHSIIDTLQQLPEVKLLVTSREHLNLMQEWVFELYGLPIPPPGADWEKEDYDSAALFVHIARQKRANFTLSAEDKPAVSHICRLLEGMPLGIELAASWIQVLSCQEIAQEIENNLDFLASTLRDIPERHRSLRAVFDHSWELLTEEERRVLLWLSTFRGGFRREAAEAVAGATLSMLSTLVAKSLIRRSGASRYDLHELVRQFAAERFAGHSIEQSASQASHAQYYLAYFNRAEKRLRSSAQVQTLIELTAEMDNFRTAWDWAIAHGEFALIEQTMRMFFRLYDTRGWYREGLGALDRAIEALETAHGQSPSDRTDQITLGHLLATRSWFAYRLADYEQAQQMLERCMEILRPLNEPFVLVEAITYLGRVMESVGEYARALELYTEGLEVAKAIGDRWFKAVCLMLHTALVGITNDTVAPEVTYQMLQSIVAEWRIIGDPRLIAFGLDFLSRSALRLERYDKARLALEENVALNSSIGFGWGLGTAYRGLGTVAQAQGDHQQAVDMFHKSLDTFTKLGGSWYIAQTLADMGWSICALGNHQEAEQTWRESLRIATDIHAIPVVLEALAGMASLQAKLGHEEYALELLSIITDHPASFQKTRDSATQLRRQLELCLSPQQIEAIQEQVQSESFEKIIQELQNA